MSHKNTTFHGIFMGFEADFVLKNSVFHQLSQILEGVGCQPRIPEICSHKNTMKDIIFGEYMDRAFRLKKNQAKNISESKVMIQNKKSVFLVQKNRFS